MILGLPSMPSSTGVVSGTGGGGGLSSRGKLGVEAERHYAPTSLRVGELDTIAPDIDLAQERDLRALPRFRFDSSLPRRRRARRRMMARLAAATRRTARGKQLMNDQYDHVSKLLRDLVQDCQRNCMRRSLSSDHQQ